MRPLRPLLLSCTLLCLTSLPAWATAVTSGSSPLFQLVERDPSVDPKRIINESNQFLRNREPEMTAGEYALYEKVVGMLTVQPDFAITMLEGMQRGDEKPSAAFAFILGNAYFGAKNNAKAIASYRKAIEQNSDFLRAWSNLAVAYYAGGDYHEGARCFAKAISLGDRSPETYGLLAFCQERCGNLVSAEAAYLQALAGDLSQSDWAEGLLRIYIKGKQYLRAESIAKQLLEFKPSEGHLWLAYANVLLASDKKFEAMAALDTQAALGLADTTSRLMLGDLYAEKKLIPEALRCYAELRLEDRKLGFERMLKLAEMLQGEDKLAQAGQVLERAEPLATPETRVRLTLARALWHQEGNDHKAAKTLLTKLIEEAPLNGKALLALARCHAKLGEEARATVLLEHATHLPDVAFSACVELANMELRQRHYSRSLQFANQALAIERSAQLETFIAQLKALMEDTPASTQPSSGQS